MESVKQKRKCEECRQIGLLVIEHILKTFIARNVYTKNQEQLQISVLLLLLFSIYRRN